ncbi:putative ferric-chelate reductase 1 isoform X2 [Gracilinanus agilis]|uniref:putative ferric-chelate reductase 1 isoform X2 n=1 Tax=Gracilinanus agilis TaxID=191870 RepID=UPI001CFDC469|nr:putative ferric-chelate reductase 1 isoform X2 [Gracilinanus agilis]
MSLEFLGNQSFRCEMSGLSEGYISIGFSSDTLMGNDDVYICLLNDNGEVGVQYGYNTGRRPPTINPLGEVRDIETSFTNGVIKCRFITSNPISIGQSNSDYLYYIFLALGPSQNGTIRKHTTTPLVTTQKEDISKPIDVSGTFSSVPIIIKFHGSIMLIAWMVIGNVGMVFARFWKNVMVKQVLGKDLWFQAHRSLMTLTVVCVMIAFILPFIHVKGWSGNWPHPILGCVVMVLALLQPVIALFRPSPQHKRRIIFNWFHAVTAFALRILSDVALLLGFKIIDKSPDIWMEKVMGGLVGWGLLRDVIFHANAYFLRKDGDENPKRKCLLQTFSFVKLT